MAPRIAAVTGAAGGLGMSICRALARAGAVIVVIDVNEERAQAAAGQLMAEGLGVALSLGIDVTSWTAVEEGFSRLGREAGGLDVLVNNAGVREIKGIEELDAQEWARVLGVNLSGPFHCAKAAVPLMKCRGGGNIVNIASIAGLVGIRNRAAYCSSKHGVVGLTRTLAFDLARHDIRVNAVAPGVIPTEMTQSYFSDPVFLKEIGQSVAQGRAGRPEYIGAAVAYLCSPEAAYITGVVLPVDGGFLAEKSLTTDASTAFAAGRPSSLSGD